MADRLANSLTTLTGANSVAGDYFLTLDVSDTTDDATGTLKKILRSELEIALGSLPPTKQILTVGTGTNLPTGCTLIKVTVTGAGAGGGGCAGSATLAGCGSGGGGGATAIKWIAAPTTTYAYTVGAKGTGGTAGANNGVVGNNSTFGAGGSLITAPGGGVGVAGVLGSTVVASMAVQGGTPGAVSTGGDINSMGYPGEMTIRTAATAINGGNGGASYWGSGAVFANSNSAGNAASTLGSGGSGGNVQSVNTARVGGNGVDGTILVEEYYE